jgi:hypothetical protein
LPAHYAAAVVVAGRRGVPFYGRDGVAVVLLDDTDMVSGGVFVKLK